jgi:hypothetical protein
MIGFVAACSTSGRSGRGSSTALSITEPRQSDIGKWVRIEGIVSSSKMPDIHGIDVEMPPDQDLRGRLAWAEGILVSYTVTPEQIKSRVIQSRGPGTFYWLKDRNSNRAAVAHPLAVIDDSVKH